MLPPFTRIRDALGYLQEQVESLLREKGDNAPERTDGDALAVAHDVLSRGIYLAVTTDEAGYPKSGDDPEGYPIVLTGIFYAENFDPSASDQEADTWRAWLNAAGHMATGIQFARIPPDRIKLPIVSYSSVQWLSQRIWLPPGSVVCVIKVFGQWWIIGAIDDRVQVIRGTLVRGDDGWWIRDPLRVFPAGAYTIHDIECLNSTSPPTTTTTTTTTTSTTTTSTTTPPPPRCTPTTTTTTTTSTTTTTTYDPGTTTTTTSTTTTTTPALHCFVRVSNPLGMTLRDGAEALAALEQIGEWIIIQVSGSGKTSASSTSNSTPSGSTVPSPPKLASPITPASKCSGSYCHVTCSEGTATVECSDCEGDCQCPDFECGEGEYDVYLACEEKRECSGFCGWEWDQENNQWNLIEECGEGCECCYPDFCGSENSTYTRMPCRKKGQSEQCPETNFPAGMDCTTTTSSTTTTTPEGWEPPYGDCGEYEPGHPCCPSADLEVPPKPSQQMPGPCPEAKCFWKAMQHLGKLVWHLVSNPCGHCGCASPTRYPDHPCDYEMTSCLPPPPPEPPMDCIPCTGYCRYQWSSIWGGYVLVDRACFSQYPDVTCDPCIELAANGRRIYVPDRVCDCPSVGYHCQGYATFVCTSGYWVMVSSCGPNCMPVIDWSGTSCSTPDQQLTVSCVPATSETACAWMEDLILSCVKYCGSYHCND